MEGNVRKYILNITVLFCLTFINIQAQQLDIQCRHLTVEDGLSISTVTKIFQDSKGFIWIGTNNGLNRFDGYNFTVFLPIGSDSTSISDYSITSICEDTKGYIWIGTSGGLNKFDRKTETFVRYQNNPEDPNSLSHNNIYSIIKDRSGTIWIGTLNGLNKYNPESDNFTVIKKVSDRLNPESMNSVTEIHEDREENLWLGTWNGMTCIQKNGNILLQFFAQPAESKKFEFRVTSSIFVDRNNDLWVGTNGKGLKKLDHNTNSFTEYISSEGNQNSISNNYITSIFQDDTGTIWIGTLWGLNKYNPETDNFSRFISEPEKSSSLISSGITAITQDMTGLIWIGTSSGISYFKKPNNQFHYIQEYYDQPSKGLINGSIITAFMDRKDNLWIGTMGGLSKVNKERDYIVHFLHNPGNANSVSSNFIRSVFVDHLGYVWIGTNNEGLNRYDPTTGKYKIYLYDRDDSTTISNKGITAITEDRDGNMWFGTWWGLNKYDRKTEKFTRYFADPNDSNSLNSDYIWDLLFDSKGFLWISTNSGGVSLLDIKENTFINFSTRPNSKYFISDNRVFAIFESKDGMIWFGTSNGLNSFDRNTGKTNVYTMMNGLAGNQINGIQEDNSGRLWLCTDKGLSEYDRKNNKIINYGKRNGLIGMEFAQNFAEKSSDGTLYFGLSGLMYFHPDSIKEEYLNAPVIFTDLKFFNKPVQISKDGTLNRSISSSKVINIPAGQDVITIEFALFDFYAPKKNTFRYKLENFDIDWNPVGQRNSATYTNLPPGEYTFYVRASNNNGVKNEMESSIKLVIEPKFFQTLWFKILIVFGIIGITFLIINQRTRQIKKHNKILENRVAERTKDLDQTIFELNQEINERKRAEEKVQQSLEEKEVLLKEIHHRVKNNLQVISSLLYLQSLSLKDEETIALFEDSQNRIKSMALIHEKLYQSKDFGEIDFNDYVNSLLSNLNRSNTKAGMTITTNVDVKDVKLSLDTAISCGLMVNELVTNAFKYAFPQKWLDEKGKDFEPTFTIKIEEIEKDKYSLIVSDNGIGIPPELDIENTESLGLKLVVSMVSQLNGKLSISRENGTQFKIEFSDVS